VATHWRRLTRNAHNNTQQSVKFNLPVNLGFAQNHSLVQIADVGKRYVPV